MGDTSAPVQVLDRSGIGASQAAAAVGLSPWTPPIALFEQLVGAGHAAAEDTDAMRWGRYLEQPIRQAYVDSTGHSVHVPDRSLFHDEHTWRRCTPDGLVVGQETDGAHCAWGLEIKTADIHARDEWGPAGSDLVPIQYACQCAWSMHVLDLDRWDLAVLIGGRDFRVYTLRRDRDFEDELVGSVTAFWERHVLARVPPPPDHTDAFRRFLERRHPYTRADYLPADGLTEELVASMLERRVRMAELEREDARDCNRLRALIGDAAGLVTARGKVHWKPVKARMVTSWENVARQIKQEVGLEEEHFVRVIGENQHPSRASRPLKLPRLPKAALEAAPVTDDEEDIFA